MTNNTNKYIEVLRKKGLKINDQEIDKINDILFKVNSSVINEYRYIFIDKTTNKFYEEINFWSIYALYNFDKNLRIVYFKYILKVESQIKSVIANVFISLYGENGYLQLNNFDLIDKNKELDFSKVKEVLNLISKLESDLSNKIDKNKLLMNTMIEKGYIPFDIFVNYLTLGEISNFFSLMKKNDQILVSKNFNIFYEDLIFYLKNLTVSRNVCAHDEKFFDFQYRKITRTKNIKNFKMFNKQNDNDAFIIAIIIFSILGKKDTDEFIELIDYEFLNLQKYISESMIIKVREKMGFNENWKSLSKL